MASFEIAELQKTMALLSENDIQVLEALDTEIPTLPSEIASELYLLPDVVLKSLEKLKGLSFVIVEKPTLTQSSRFTEGQNVLVLTEIGKKAQTLTSLIKDSPKSETRNFRSKGRYLKK